jgi:large subunit ribosomal protein L30
MITVIRIKGQVGLNSKVVETFNRLKLRKKYSCIVLKSPTIEQLGMIKKLRNFVAYGDIDEATYNELVKKRGGKIKNFFRLHPPRKGIDSKKHFGVDKGVLGDNKSEINKLIMRML